MFYPDIHHGEHKCDTRLGPCPGPKPADYMVIRRGKDRSQTRIEVVTHYINHGNTWQPATKRTLVKNWHLVGQTGEWDYLILTEDDVTSVDRHLRE